MFKWRSALSVLSRRRRAPQPPSPAFSQSAERLNARTAGSGLTTHASRLTTLGALLRLSIAAAAVLAPSIARAQETDKIINQATFSYTVAGDSQTYTGVTTQSTLIDPRGKVKGCGGAPLPDYTGFTIGLFDPDPSDPTGTGTRGLVQLTPTSLTPGGGTRLPLGAPPNGQNVNPFPLSTADQGAYSFLLDPTKGQLDVGRAYILVLTPPTGSGYTQRRVRVVVAGNSGGIITYTATAVDGQPLNPPDPSTSVTRTAAFQYNPDNGLALAALNINISDCQAQEVQISKMGDRLFAQPGDTVVYRVTVHNPTNATLQAIQVTDTLPVGFDLVANSVRAQFQGKPVKMTVQRNGRTSIFSADESFTLPKEQAFDIAYAAVLTPEALHGDGLNQASVMGRVTVFVNGQSLVRIVTDGPAVFGVKVRQGILTDTGTIIGRVFVDRNFDGEQQGDEPGVPNAVVVLDDSTRVVTDANGMFSVSTVPSGYHTAVLDFRSLLGYRMAPNRRFIERNSPSRLAHLEPGGLVRMNFGVVAPPKTEARHP